MSYEPRPTLTPEERALDHARSDSYYLLKATLITIQRPGMSLDDVEHAIENLKRAQTKLEKYADDLEELVDEAE